MLQLALLLTCAPALAFDGHQATEGDLTVLIEEPGPVTERNVAVPVRITLANAGDGTISGTVFIRRMIDDTRVVGRSECPFDVASGERTHADFAVSFGKGTYSARYPIHAFVDFRQGGRRLNAHAVRIVLTRFAEPPNAAELDAPIIVPDHGALPLLSTGRHRPLAVRPGAPTVELPLGWAGREAESNMHLAIRPVTRGDVRDVGEPPAVGRRPLDELAAENERRGRRLLDRQDEADGLTTFLVGDGANRIAIVLSPTDRGLVDGVLTMVSGSSAVSFDGLHVDILKQPVMRWPYPVEFLGYEAARQGARAVHTHNLRVGGKPVDLTLTFWTEGGGLRLSFHCPLRITDFALGPSDRAADSVYYGHGYRIDQPETFTANFGGHDLSTSHVGVDYAGGLSLLQAVDVPPLSFCVNPDSREYSLHTRLNGTMTMSVSSPTPPTSATTS